jgi:small redox-active disulfide protein 2
MLIKILGTGCKKCLTLEAKVKEFVAAKSIEAEIEKVTELNDIMEYGILMTPGLVIDGKVVSTGKIPSEEELASYLRG